ncbi:MAG: hypothetical protein ACOYN0_10445 [Phycisphaerales bacterium]
MLSGLAPELVRVESPAEMRRAVLTAEDIPASLAFAADRERRVMSRSA